MPTFAYKARDDIGKAIVGTMDAISEDELLKKLRKLLMRCCQNKS